MYRWRPGEGHTVWRKPSHHANGNTVDREGRLLTCEHGSRRVTRTERDGSVTVLAESYRGRKLNSPNDVVVKSDGSIWFTDPPYGIEPGEREQPANFVFRLPGAGEEPVALIDDFSRPNGLCFSPEEELLYVADSDHEIHHVRRFRVRGDGGLEGGEVFATIEPGIPDGMRVDAAGRLYVSAKDGVQVFDAEGVLLGKIRTPETAANCTFGGEGKRTLFITAVSTVWAVELAVRGR
jgi:gluconolactonase